VTMLSWRRHYPKLNLCLLIITCSAQTNWFHKAGLTKTTYLISTTATKFYASSLLVLALIRTPLLLQHRSHDPSASLPVLVWLNPDFRGTTSDSDMTRFLDLPLELRNHVYELLLCEEVEHSFRGVMVVSEIYVRKDLPQRSYHGLLRTCRQIHREFKQAIQHQVASKRLNYELDITFSHGRPYFSLTWKRFAALSPTINQLFINVDLRTREPLRDGPREAFVPHEHELTHLLEHSPTCFAKQLFDYIAIFLKTLAHLLFQGNPQFSILYTENMTLNLRTPTKVVALGGSGHNPITLSRRLRVDQTEARELHDTMRNTLQATSKNFQAFNANKCDQLFPLIQIGSLHFATEGDVWGEGNNLVLAHDDFQWLRYQ
jgi:hypothetical protein